MKFFMNDVELLFFINIDIEILFRIKMFFVLFMFWKLRFNDVYWFDKMVFMGLECFSIYMYCVLSRRKNYD